MDWTVRECEVSDWNEIKDIWSTRINPPEDHMIEWLHAAQRDNTVTAIIAENNENVILGFGFYAVANNDWMESYIDEIDVSSIIQNEQGVIEAIAVKSGYDGNGIASSILDEELRMLSKRTVEYAYAMSWNRDNHVDSRVLFDKFGFELVEEIEDYYARIPETVNCIDCATGCECDATLHRKNITEYEPMITNDVEFNTRA